MTLEATEATPEETQPTEPEATPAAAEETPAGAPAETPSAEPEAKAEPAAEPEAALAEETAEAKAEKHRRAGGWQRKAERLERENAAKDALLQQLLAGQAQPSSAQPGKEKAPEEKAAEYIDGLVEQRLAARETQRQQQAAQAEFQKRAAEVRAAHPDLEEALEDVAHIPVPAHVQGALLTSEQGPAIMYQLAKNPAELARISALPPLDAAREIGRLEAKAASSTAAPKAQPTVTRRPAAPAPISPVTARGPSNVKPTDQMSYEEFCAWRESQRKK